MYICNVIEDPPCALPYIMYIHDVQVTIVHYMTVKTALRTHTANINPQGAEYRARDVDREQTDS